MSAIDISEINQPNLASQQEKDDQELAQVFRTTSSNSASAQPNAETYRIRRPKRVLHFSDGTLEEYDTDESDGGENYEKDTHAMDSSKPSVNPKFLSWPGWFQHYTSKSAKKTLDALDYAGETVAYYLGITTPKYQYEIDEYKRMQEEEAAKKKAREEELASWGTATGIAGSPAPPITTEDRIPTGIVPVQQTISDPSESEDRQNHV